MNQLVRLTLGFGIVLIVMGIGAYVVSAPEQQSMTALIPAIIGVLLLIAGWGATNPKTGRISGIAAVVLVLLLALGSIRGLINFINAFASGGSPSIGAITQVLIVILAFLYLIFAFTHMRGRMKGKRPESAS